MQKITLGKTDIQASVVALGTWVSGGWMWGGAEESDSIDTIRAALDNGVTMVDTAPVYGFGNSETVVGKALRGIPRDQVVIATKCGLVWTQEEWPADRGTFHIYSTIAGMGSAEHFDYRIYRYLRPESIRAEVESSLRRLQTDYIDLLQTHAQDDTTPVDDTMAELLKLKDEGKIRAIGASNLHGLEQMKAYNANGGLDVIQERYSLLDRELEANGMMDYARESGIGLLAYSPMCRGLLTGKLSPDRIFGEGDLRNFESRFSPENRRKVNQQLAELTPLAEKHGLTTTQLIIAWTFHKNPKTNVLCGARTPHQILENVAAGDAILSTDDLDWIESVFQK